MTTGKEHSSPNCLWRRKRMEASRALETASLRLLSYHFAQGLLA
jgi:hypothetical protein